MKTFDLKDFKSRGGQVHFIGCAGAGTQPLASIFLDLGFPCSGSDLLETERTEQLQARGMKVYRGHAAENLPPEGTPLLVVHTSAARVRNPELEEAHRRGVPVMRRGEALAHLGTLFPHTIAVAGSHGKTSVTSLIAHALKKLGYDPGYLIGGSVTGWNISGTAGGRSVFVTEVDESDSTNALFRAEIAVVTNIEDDHSWSVGGVQALFDSFVTFAKKADQLIYVPGTHTEELFRNLPDSIRVPAELSARTPYPSVWGGFQRQNARTAFAALREFCKTTISDEEIASALFTFPGVERRMSMRFDNGTFRLIEDYAHHPTELKASLDALKETNPGRRLVVIFQPHRFARLKQYFGEFVEILSQQSDLVLIPPVFAAWTDKSELDSHALAEQIGNKAIALDGDWCEIARKTVDQIQQGDLIAVIGAGDVIEIIPPLEQLLMEKSGI